ncbi:MAG: glycosyltransferase family protein [Planctomycetaceae bacterium]
MARIAIGLCGEGRGHAARVCTLVERLGGSHEYLIATATEALEFLRRRFAGRGDVRLVEVPGIRFRYVGNRLDVPQTILDGLHFAARELPRQVTRLARLLDSFEPALAITDFEPALPRAAARLGVPVVSLDHQHFLVAYDLGRLPPTLRCTARFMGLACRLFVPRATATVVSAFFRPPLVAGWRHAVQAGPLLRTAILAATPHDAGHLVSYVRRHTPAEVIGALATAGLPVRVYGLGRREAVGPITFHDIDEQRFVADLAGCRGVVAAAGNQLIGEALHLGKPLLVLPERAHAEQTMNAHFLAAEGCGTFAPLESVTAATIRGFLDDLDRFAGPLAERRGRMDGFPDAARAIAASMQRETIGRSAEVAAAA